MDTAADQVASVPGVDLIVINMAPIQAEGAVAAARTHAKLMSTPILVLAPADQVPTVTQAMSLHKNVIVTTVAASPEEIASAVEQSLGSGHGAALQEESALNYAVTALDVLFDIAKEAGDTFRVADAQPALVSALKDPRDPVVLGAAAVLARINANSAQQPIADAGLDTGRAEELRIPLLRPSFRRSPSMRNSRRRRRSAPLRRPSRERRSSAGKGRSRCVPGKRSTSG
jgi:hypothetical protein